MNTAGLMLIFHIRIVPLEFQELHIMTGSFPWRQRLLSIEDIIVRRQRSEFVGRAKEIGIFTDNLKLAAGDSQKKYILSISGQSGAGKTTLLHWLRDIAVNNGDFAAYVDITDLDPIDLMTKIADLLSASFLKSATLLG